MRTPLSLVVVARLLASVFGVLFLFFFTTARTARADIFQLQFTFNNFNANNTSFTPPVDPVSGTIIFDKSPINFSVLSVISIALTIAGHSYSAAPPLGFLNGPGPFTPISFSSVWSDCVLGCHVGVGTDNFGIVWLTDTGAATNMFYAVSSIPNVFESRTASVFSFTPVGAALRHRPRRIGSARVEKEAEGYGEIEGDCNLMTSITERPHVSHSHLPL
jgi:hypothetical protein